MNAAHPFSTCPLARMTPVAAASLSSPVALNVCASPRPDTRIGGEDAKLLDKLSARAAAAAGKVRAIMIVW